MSNPKSKATPTPVAESAEAAQVALLVTCSVPGYEVLAEVDELLFPATIEVDDASGTVTVRVGAAGDGLVPTYAHRDVLDAVRGLQDAHAAGRLGEVIEGDNPAEKLTEAIGELERRLGQIDAELAALRDYKPRLTSLVLALRNEVAALMAQKGRLT